MKKDLKIQIYIYLFLAICMNIGIVITRPIIEAEGGSFWQTLLAASSGIFLAFVCIIFLSWRKSKRKKDNIPEVDERTLNNMKEAMLWACVLILMISSVLALILMFVGIKQIETGWLVVYMIPMWFILLSSLMIGKSR